MLTISDNDKILELQNQITVQKQQNTSESKELVVILNLAFYTGVNQNTIPSLQVRDIAFDDNRRPRRMLNYDLWKAEPAIAEYFNEYHTRSPKKKNFISLFKNRKQIQRRLDDLGYPFSTFRLYGRKLFISEWNDAGLHKSDICEKVSDFYQVSLDWIRDNYYKYFLPENSAYSNSPYVFAIYKFKHLENEKNNPESYQEEIRKEYQQITDQNEKRIIEKLANDFRFPL